MAVKKLCGACGNDALDRNPNCPACANRHARWCRTGDPRGIPNPHKNVCAACGQPAHQTNPNCKTCIKREQRRAKAEGREPYIPSMTTQAMAAPPVPVTTLTTARDVHNHEALTGWLTARRNRLTPPAKEKKMTTHTTLTVSHPRRFNEKKFVETYSPEAFPQFYTTVQKVNLKALAPNLKDEYADDTTARLTIR